MVQLGPDATVATAARAYGRARDALLTVNPDHKREEVRDLDDAFFAFRNAVERTRSARLARYRKAQIRIGMPDRTVLLTPSDQRTQRGEFPFDAERVHILTAYNPVNQRPDSATNLGRQDSLVAHLENMGLRTWHAIGGNQDRTHEEVSVAVAGLTDDEARSIGARWGQDAVFAWTRENWQVLSCQSAEVYLIGWTTEVISKPLRDAVAQRREGQVARAAEAADKAAAEARDAELHQQHIAAGWPAPWPPALVDRFQAAGGDAPTAGTFQVAGWTPEEINQALDVEQVHAGALRLRPPEGPAPLHRLHRDTLGDLAAGLWPPVPRGTVLSLKRRWASGRRERWAVSVDQGRHLLHHFRHSAARGWQPIEQTAMGEADLRRALATEASITTLRPRVVSEFTIDPEALPPALFVELLRVTPGDPEDAAIWPEELADPWTASDELLTEILPDVTWCPRWASVNEYRIGAIVIDDGRPRLRPVLVDEGESHPVAIQTIAECVWSSEGGGAPISWYGGNRLADLGHGVGFTTWWGDVEGTNEVVDLPGSPIQLGTAVAQWVMEADADFAAALALEPLDPHRRISDDQRQNWDDLLDAVTTTFEHNLPEEAEHALRRCLGQQSEIYGRTLHALTDPGGRDGQALLSTLQSFTEDEVLGPLVWGNWDYDAQQV